MEKPPTAAVISNTPAKKKKSTPAKSRTSSIAPTTATTTTTSAAAAAAAALSAKKRRNEPPSAPAVLHLVGAQICQVLDLPSGTNPSEAVDMIKPTDDLWLKLDGESRQILRDSLHTDSRLYILRVRADCVSGIELPDAVASSSSKKPKKSRSASSNKRSAKSEQPVACWYYFKTGPMALPFFNGHYKFEVDIDRRDDDPSRAFTDLAQARASAPRRVVGLHCFLQDPSRMGLPNTVSTGVAGVTGVTAELLISVMRSTFGGPFADEFCEMIKAVVSDTTQRIDSMSHLDDMLFGRYKLGDIYMQTCDANLANRLFIQRELCYWAFREIFLGADYIRLCNFMDPIALVNQSAVFIGKLAAQLSDIAAQGEKDVTGDSRILLRLFLSPDVSVPRFTDGAALVEFMDEYVKTGSKLMENLLPPGFDSREFGRPVAVASAPSGGNPSFPSKPLASKPLGVVEAHEATCTRAAEWYNRLRCVYSRVAMDSFVQRGDAFPTMSMVPEMSVYVEYLVRHRIIGISGDVSAALTAQRRAQSNNKTVLRNGGSALERYDESIGIAAASSSSSSSSSSKKTVFARHEYQIVSETVQQTLADVIEKWTQTTEQASGVGQTHRQSYIEALSRNISMWRRDEDGPTAELRAQAAELLGLPIAFIDSSSSYAEKKKPGPSLQALAMDLADFRLGPSDSDLTRYFTFNSTMFKKPASEDRFVCLYEVEKWTPHQLRETLKAVFRNWDTAEPTSGTKVIWIFADRYALDVGSVTLLDAIFKLKPFEHMVQQHSIRASTIAHSYISDLLNNDKSPENRIKGVDLPPDEYFYSTQTDAPTYDLHYVSARTLDWSRRACPLVPITLQDLPQLRELYKRPLCVKVNLTAVKNIRELYTISCYVRRRIVLVGAPNALQAVFMASSRDVKEDYCVITRQRKYSYRPDGLLDLWSSLRDPMENADNVPLSPALLLTKKTGTTVVASY